MSDETKTVPRVTSGEALWMAFGDANTCVNASQQSKQSVSGGDKQGLLDCCREGQPLNRFHAVPEQNQMFKRKGSMERLPHFDHGDDNTSVRSSFDKVPPAPPVDQQ